MLTQEPHDLAAHLQTRHVPVEIQPIEALHRAAQCSASRSFTLTTVPIVTLPNEARLGAPSLAPRPRNVQRRCNPPWRSKACLIRTSVCRGAGWPFCLACGIAFIAPAGTSVASSAGTGQVPGGLDTTATTTYTVDLPAGLVPGRIEFGFVNSIPPDYDDDAEFTFFEGYQFSLPGATNVAATTSPGRSPSPPRPRPVPGGVGRLRDDARLLGRARSGGHVRPTGPPRDPRPWRANEAFVAFTVAGDSATRGSAVRIVTPAAAAVAMPELDDGTTRCPRS